MERVHAKYFHAEKTPNKIVFILRLMHAFVLNLAAGQSGSISVHMHGQKKFAGQNL